MAVARRLTHALRNHGNLKRPESDPLLLGDPASLHLLSSHVFFSSSPTLPSWPPSFSPRHLLPLFLPLFLSPTGWAGPIPEYSVRPPFHSRISTVQAQPLAEEHQKRSCWPGRLRLQDAETTPQDTRTRRLTLDQDQQPDAGPATTSPEPQPDPSARPAETSHNQQRLLGEFDGPAVNR